MKSKITKTKLLWVLMVGLLMATRPVFAEENVQDLKKQIEELKAKVAELEAHQNAIPSEETLFPMMNNGQWDPFAEIERMQNEMGRMINHAFNQPLSPHSGMFSNKLFFDNTQMEETKDGYLIKLNIGGFDKDKIDINVNQNSISISGEYKGEEKQKDQNGMFELHNYGKFLNSIPVPPNADVSKMKTEKKDNQMEIYLPKKT